MANNKLPIADWHFWFAIMGAVGTALLMYNSLSVANARIETDLQHLKLEMKVIRSDMDDIKRKFVGETDGEDVALK